MKNSPVGHIRAKIFGVGLSIIFSLTVYATNSNYSLASGGSHTTNEGHHHSGDAPGKFCFDKHPPVKPPKTPPTPAPVPPTPPAPTPTPVPSPGPAPVPPIPGPITPPLPAPAPGPLPLPAPAPAPTPKPSPAPAPGGPGVSGSPSTPKPVEPPTPSPAPVSGALPEPAPGGSPSTAPSTTPAQSPGEAQVPGANEKPAAVTESQNNLRARLRPSMYLDFDRATQLVNLSHTSLDRDQNSLRLNANEKGYKVSYYSLLEGGLGANIAFDFAKATGIHKNLWGNIGIIPIKGQEAYFTRYAKTLKAAETMTKQSQIPSAEELLNVWHDGDSLQYSARGGTIGWAGLGVAMAGYTHAKVTEGVQQINIEKVEDTYVAVRVQNIKVDRVSDSTSALIISAGKPAHDEGSEGDSFLINLAYPQATEVVKNLIHGNKIPAQEAAKEGRYVVTIDTFTRTQTGNLRFIFFGLPIIANASNSSGKISELTKTDVTSLGLKRNIQYGIYLKTKQGRLGNIHVSNTESFYGAAFEVKTSANEFIEGYFGQYHFEVLDDHAFSGNFERGQQELIRRTGLSRYLSAQVPSSVNLGYLKILFTVNFNEEQTDRMIKAALTPQMSTLSTVAQSQTKDYFYDNQDSLDLCRKDNSHEDAGNSHCAADTARITQQAIENMKKALAKMSKARSTQSKADFVEAYAEFGEAMLSNPFTFQFAMNLAGSGVAMEYTVETTSLTSFRMILTSTEAPGVYAKSYQALKFENGIIMPTNGISAKGLGVFTPFVSPTVAP